METSLPFHMYTLWLFTRTDLKTIVIPSTIFGVACTLSGPLLTTGTSPSITGLSMRIPLIVYWAWINLLPFAIDNQRQQDSIAEDAMNKKWRPLPSRRLTPSHARSAMLVFYVVAITSSMRIGGLRQCFTLIFFGHWYNDREGADTSCLIRNFINACGYIAFMSGTLEVACDPSITSPNLRAYYWLLVIGLVIFTTIHSQDLCDQAGDRIRMRKTVPLVLGDSACRWTIAIAVSFWSCFCPTFWQLKAYGLAPTMFLGAVIAWRTMSKRTTKADRLTFRIYNLWVVMIFCLPLMKYKSHL